MWVCQKCRESLEDQFESCWNCGTCKDGSDPDKSFVKAITAFTPLVNSELVASYEQGQWKVKLYSTRIGISMLWRYESYQYSEIQSFQIEDYMWGMFKHLTLRLWNGKNIPQIAIPTKKANEFKINLEKLIRSPQISSGDNNGVSISCTYLGGSGVQSLVQGSFCRIAFGSNAAIIGVSYNKVEIKYNQITALKLEGQGRVTTNAGVMGGGFGLEGAAWGIAAAALLNNLTTKTSTNTVLYLAWPGAEAFLHTSEYSPDEARLVLSHVFTATQSVNSVKNNSDIDLASQLERLASLSNSGALTDEEYSLAKAKLISG
jgi:hypothetical protein